MKKHLETAKHEREMVGRENIEVVEHYKYKPRLITQNIIKNQSITNKIRSSPTNETNESSHYKKHFIDNNVFLASSENPIKLKKKVYFNKNTIYE